MFSYPDASQALGLPVFLLNSSVPAKGASIDTRTLRQGDLFIALPGEKADGHLFLEEAFRKGASGAIIQRKIFEANPERYLEHGETFQNLLIAEDNQKTLTDLALWHRSRFKIPVMGVTGSVGKTTTKEFLFYLLSQRMKGVANAGNLNNHLGLPLTLLRLDTDCQFCLAELGANHRHEILNLAKILQPTAGIITQIAPVHLEGFGSLDAVYETKLELFEALPSGAVAIIPDHDSKLIRMSQGFNVGLVRVGISPNSHYRLSRVTVKNGRVSFCMNEKYEFAFSSSASFLAANAAMAVAMADLMGIPMAEMPGVWDDLKLPSGRFQEHVLDEGIRVVYDGYNANPVSFRKALEAFDAMECEGRKVLVFADMLELGDMAYPLHEELGRDIAKYHFDFVAGYGELAKISLQILEEQSKFSFVQRFDNPHDAAKFLNSYLRPGDAVLLKASRGMKIDEVLNDLKGQVSTPNREEVQH